MARARVKHGRWWRWPLYGLAGFVVLLGVLAGALFVGLQTSWAREQIRQQVNSGLAEVFQGKLQLERLGRVTLWGVSGVDARVFDARGQQIVRAQGLSASASLAGLGWQLATRSDAPELYIAAVHIDHADVTLREDEEVGVTLASAFLPRPTAVPAPPSPPGSGPRLHVGRLTFDSVWAHGRASGSPPLDAELRRLKASLKQSPRDGFALDLASVDLVTRGLPLAADPRGNVTGIVESPPDGAGPLRLEVTLDGQAAGSPLALEASWVGDDLHARVNLPHLPAAFVNRQAPTLLLDGDVALAAEVDGPLPQLDFQAEIVATAGHVLATGYAVVAQGLELGATVEATDLNLARVVPTAPPSALSLRTRALLLEQQDGHFALGYRLDVEPGQVAAEATPALWLTGRAELDADTGVVGAGKLGASEAGTSLLGAYRVALPRERGGEVALSLDARLDDPQRLAALGIHTAGTASVVAQLDLERSAVAAKASLSLGRVDQALVQARNVEVMAQLSGSLDDPRVHAAATLDVLSGRAHADLDYSSRAERLELFVADVDLLRLSHTLGVKLPLEHGTLGLDAVVTRSAPSPRYQLEATAQAELGKLGALKLVAHELELPTAAPSLSRLGALRGQLIVSGNVELETLSPLLTAAGVPIERTTGHVRFEAEAKQSADATQGLQLSAQIDTNGLRVVQQRKTADELKTTADAIDSGPVALEGIDLHLSLHAWPQSGEVVGTLLLRDPGGTLLETQAEAQLAGVWPAGLTDVEALSRVPLKVTLEVPRRRLQSLPALLRPAALRGRFALAAEGEGSLVDPHFKAQISVESLRAAGSKAPIDAAADVIYAPDGGSARIDAKMTSTALAVATVNTTWRGDLRRAGELAGGATGITASADVSLVDFPLDVVPLIVDRQVNGRVSGELKLTNWGSDARVDASFSSTSLVVGKFPIQELKLAARTEAGKLLAELGVKAGSGTSKGTLDAGMHWGKRPLPELEHRGTAKLATTAFKLETLSPLLGAYVSEIGGVLDANTEISVTPTTTALSGTAKLEKGVVQLPAIGQRFSDISARVAVADNQFKLERLEARGTTGRVTMKGAARLDGFALRGADAQIAIAKNESLPLTLEGAAIGDAWGNVNAVYKSPAQGEKQLDIDVPEFHLVTPETGGGSIQSLDANEEIHVGVRRADGKFVSLPVQPLEPSSSDATAAEPAQPLRIHVKLGRNISVERGRTAQAQLTGQLTILVAGTTEVDGRIEVRGGKLDVQGKTFEIERGVVTFDGNDPGNPTITATARWDAPGYTVYADYLGDVQNGRIKLHSEPPLTQDEIASLLLFGSPEGSVGGSGSSNAALAVSVAGDTAAKGLNQVLDDFTNLDVSARIDTTTGSARPELVFQVSPRVSAKVTRAVGAPALGESPDRTFLTLELRLKRAWALSALFGDRGASALDLIWRRRY